MITHDDQMKLFTLISKSLKRDLACYAFGGTAMMFYGYKDETKDVDLLFDGLDERKEFIQVIINAGFEETSPLKIYIPEKLRDPHRPLMFKKEDTRFDLFSKKIFRTILSPKMQEDVFAVHDFRDNHRLQVRVLRSEHIVLLKAVTERDRDFEDIVTILRRNQSFNWQYFIDEVIWQFQHGNDWALLDVEKMLQELKNYAFVDSKYTKQLHALTEEKKKK